MSKKREEEYIKGTLGPVDVIRARKIRQIFAMERKPDPYKKKLVLWFKGDTGEGKTRSATAAIAELSTRSQSNRQSTSNKAWYSCYAYSKQP